MSIKLTEGGLQLPRYLAYNRRDEWPGIAEIHTEWYLNEYGERIKEFKSIRFKL